MVIVVDSSGRLGDCRAETLGWGPQKILDEMKQTVHHLRQLRFGVLQEVQQPSAWVFWRCLQGHHHRHFQIIDSRVFCCRSGWGFLNQSVNSTAWKTSDSSRHMLYSSGEYHKTLWTAYCSSQLPRHFCQMQLQQLLPVQDSMLLKSENRWCRKGITNAIVWMAAKWRHFTFFAW